MESSLPTLLATDHELFVGDLIDQMRKQRQEKSRSYRHLPYFQHLGSEEVFEALDRVKQANLLQIQLKMQKDCSYLQHMDDMSLEGRNAESVRKRVQEGKLQGGFRQIQNNGHMTVCGCLDCQLRLGNKQFNSSFQYEQSREALAQKVQRSKLTLLGSAWHGKPTLAMHLANEGDASGSLGTALHVAVLRGDVELVKLLCSRHECDTGALWGGVSALDLAIAKGFDEGGEVLLQHGAPLQHFRHETLLEACERGGTLLTRALLQQMGVFLTSHGSFLTDAAHEVLNRSNADGNTPLHLACLLPDRESTVKILVAHNAETNRENADGMTPLDCCVQTSNRAAWRALRHATGGQAKYRRFEAEQRSLPAAVASNCLFLVRKMHLRQDEDKKADRGSGPSRAELGEMLHLAVSTTGVSDEMVQYLVEQGADVNAMKDGMSVLDACLRHNNVNESLLGRHAKLNRYQDYTVFMAVKEGLTGLVRYLAGTARKGGKEGVNQRERGCLPLHVAAASGYVDIVKVLLKSNSNVHEQTDEGKTALDLACEELAKLAESEAIHPQGVFLGLCQTVDALLSRGGRLKEWHDETQLDRAKDSAQRVEEMGRREQQAQKERDETKNETRRQMRRRREESDEVLRQVEREIRTAVTEDEKKADTFKESEKLAKRVAESREVLQASWKGGEGEKLPEYLSSKYYQIRIDVLRRKIQEKDQQIEEALKKMDFAEEDYLWLLRKKMRDLRLKHHPDKITDRTPTEDDYKFYERMTKAYDVLCTKEERDKYLEMSNHVEWLQQHGEQEEARIVEKAIYDMETQKKAKKDEKKEEDPAQPPREHVERAKKKLQERREEETWEKSGEKIKALTLGTPNKCKAPVVTSQRFSERLEQCWIDFEWVCKCAYASAERIEYELRVQAIDKGAEDWAEVYHGWESSVAGLGPFPVGTYEFMVRARNSVGWGEWSDVVVVALDDPKWERQQRREAEQEVLRVQAKTLQWDLQQIIDEFHEMQDENKLTIHRASNLLFQLQAELKRARTVRNYLSKPLVLRDAEAAVRLLEQWRDRKEAFAEWKQSLMEMKNQLLHEGGGSDRPDSVDLAQFLGQDESYFCSLSPEIRNLTVQTLLGLDAKHVFKKLTAGQKDQILTALRRGVELGKAPLPSGSDDVATPSAVSSKDSPKEAKERSRTIFTKHQTEQLQKLIDRFFGAQCKVQSSPPAGVRSDRPSVDESSPRGAVSSVMQSAETLPVASRPAALSPNAVASNLSAMVHAPVEPPTSVASSEAIGAAPESPRRSAPLSPAAAEPDVSASPSSPSDKQEKRIRTVHVVGLPHREHVTRGDIVGALRPFAEVDGARVGGTDALVRFSTAEEAKSALSALEQGAVSLRRSILSGTIAVSDSLTEEALLRASGKPLPDKRPAAKQLAAPQQQPAQQLVQQLQQSAQGRQQQRPESAKLEPPRSDVAPLQQLRSQVQPSSPQSFLSTPQNVLESPTQGQLASSSSGQHQRIGVEQLVTSDSNISTFVCPLCQGIAWQPKVTMCCSKVFCGMCLDQWLQSSTSCAQCSKPLFEDGSTGGCTEQRVKKLDRNSSGVQAVLWRVYGNLRIKCAHDCGWTGTLLAYKEHLACCREASVFSRQGLQPSTSSRPSAVASAPSVPAVPAPEDAAPSLPKEVTVVWEHRAPDDAQLSLKVGDRVQVQQQAAHGWVYGRRLAPSSAGGVSEGWFPSFCLPENRPPKPQASPPPKSPPDCTTQVQRDYMASDPAQLSVTKGELVKVRQRDQSGWTFVVRVSTQGSGPREGWVPDWLLQHES